MRERRERVDAAVAKATGGSGGGGGVGGEGEGEKRAGGGGSSRGTRPRKPPRDVGGPRRVKLLLRRLPPALAEGELRAVLDKALVEVGGAMRFGFWVGGGRCPK